MSDWEDSLEFHKEVVTDDEKNKIGLFEWIKSVTTTKIDLMDDLNKSDYDVFMMNRMLSGSILNVLDVAELNLYNLDILPKHIHYQYLMKKFPKGYQKLEFSNSDKEEEKNIKAITFYYGYSRDIAREAMRVLSSEQMGKIIEYYDNRVSLEGGR